MIRGLLDAGLDVYLIDWGYPDADDRHLTWRITFTAISATAWMFCANVTATGGDQSARRLPRRGVESVLYGALSRKDPQSGHDGDPGGFSYAGQLLTHLIRHVDIDLLVDSLGNLPGQMLNFAFVSLSPFRLAGQKYVDVVDILDDAQALKNFLRMEKWIFDSPDQAGEAFRQFAKDFFQQNKLVKNEVIIGGCRVDLQKITMPVLNVYASQDHLVPPAASKALAGCCGSGDYSELCFRGGHIGIYVSGRAQQEVPPAIAAWLLARLDAPKKKGRKTTKRHQVRNP
jgi:polyhydroxyalkanoate synthase